MRRAGFDKPVLSLLRAQPEQIFQVPPVRLHSPWCGYGGLSWRHAERRPVKPDHAASAHMKKPRRSRNLRGFCHKARPLWLPCRIVASLAAKGRRHYMPMPPMPPMPPMSGMPAAGASSFGASATMASVVSSRDATEAAFCRAVRVTLVGSRIPISIMSP